MQCMTECQAIYKRAKNVRAGAVGVLVGIPVSDWVPSYKRAKDARVGAVSAGMDAVNVRVSGYKSKECYKSKELNAQADSVNDCVPSYKTAKDARVGAVSTRVDAVND